MRFFKTWLCLALLSNAFIAGVRADIIRMQVQGGLQAKPLRLSTDLRLAREDLRKGEVSKCRAHIDSYCNSHSDSPHRVVLLVSLYLEVEQKQAAHDLLAELSLDPRETFEAYFAFARLAAHEGRWQDAWAHFLVAEQAELPNRWSLGYQQSIQRNLVELKAIIATERRDWKLAHLLLIKLAEDRPNNPEILRSLATVSFHLDDLALAKLSFQKAANNDKNDALPFQVRLAWLYLQTDARESAELYFKEGAEIAGKSGQLARIEYVVWLHGENRAEEVIALLDEIRFDDSLLREQEYLRGLACRMLGDYAAAEKHFHNLHLKDPENLRISNQLALVLAESPTEEQRNRALSLAEKNASQVQTEATLSTLAWTRFRLGDVSEADRLVELLAKSPSISRDLAFYISEISRAKGREVDADKMIQRVQQASGAFYYQKWLDQSAATRSDTR